MAQIIDTIRIIYTSMIVWVALNMVLFSEKLNKKTLYKDDNRGGVPSRFLALFCIGGVFCYLFINNIKNMREVDYYESILRNDENNIHANRWLKLHKLKTRTNKWKFIKKFY